MNVNDFNVKAMNGEDVPLSKYKGKVLLIVNTATECGFTNQYKELQTLYDKYKDSSFEILDFPCNQFKEQAPGDDDAIHSFCTGRFGITFPQFSKVDVKGVDAIPLYAWLTDNTKFEGFGLDPRGLAISNILKKEDSGYRDNNSVKWNFTKFLIGRDGNIVKRFEPTFPMRKLDTEIKAVL